MTSIENGHFWEDEVLMYRRRRKLKLMIMTKYFETQRTTRSKENILDFTF